MCGPRRMGQQVNLQCVRNVSGLSTGSNPADGGDALLVWPPFCLIVFSQFHLTSLSFLSLFSLDAFPLPLPPSLLPSPFYLSLSIPQDNLLVWLVAARLTHQPMI